MTIQHMCIACLIPKATNTQSGYVTRRFSTATSFAIKQLNVTLFVHYSLSGSHYHFLPEKSVEFSAIWSQYFIWIVLVSSLYLSRQVFLNGRAAVRYRALASFIPRREGFSWNLSFYFFYSFFMNKYFIVELFWGE